MKILNLKFREGAYYVDQPGDVDGAYVQLSDHEAEITKLRDDLEKIQDSLDDSEAENGNLAEECGRLEADLEAAQRELDDAVTANHSVRVCAKHTSDITDGEGCVICDLEALKTEIEEARSALAADDTETLGEAAEHILAAARKMVSK